MDLDATHNIFKNKYPKAKEEMEERLQVCVCVCRQHVHYLFMNSYFASTLILALKKTKVTILLGFCFIIINIMEERLFSLKN